MKWGQEAVWVLSPPHPIARFERPTAWQHKMNASYPSPLAHQQVQTPPDNCHLWPQGGCWQFKCHCSNYTEATWESFSEVQQVTGWLLKLKYLDECFSLLILTFSFSHTHTILSPYRDKWPYKQCPWQDDDDHADNSIESIYGMFTLGHPSNSFVSQMCQFGDWQKAKFFLEFPEFTDINPYSSLGLSRVNTSRWVGQVRIFQGHWIF